MTKPRLLVFALVAAFALGSVPSADAVPFVFPDRAAFIFAFPGAIIENWDSYPVGTAFANGSTNAGITYSSSAGGATVTDGFLASSGANGIGGSNLGLFDTGDTMTFGFDRPLNAFGIDVNTAATNNGVYTATTNTGEVFASVFDPFPGFATGQFIGFSTSPFTSVTIAGPDGFQYTLDTLRTAPVPEPASMLLLGAGLAGLAARRYRHRQSSSRSS